MQTLTFIMLVFAAQAVIYVVRERGRMWQSRPILLMMLFSLVDIAIVSTLASGGTLMRLPSGRVIVMLSLATVAFALALDQIKVMVLARHPVD